MSYCYDLSPLLLFDAAKGGMPSLFREVCSLPELPISSVSSVSFHNCWRNGTELLKIDNI